MDTQHESACGRRLDAGPATITLPEAGNRYMAIQVIDEDHYVYEVVYGSGAHTYTREQVGTRYVFAAVRTLVDPTDPQDFERIHTLQEAITVSQPSTGSFEVPTGTRSPRRRCAPR